jgi:YVTN family beta-propeller protein
MRAITLLLLSIASPILFAQSPPKYAVTDKWQVGGDGGWDYLTADSANRRLYVSRGTHVMVIDMDSGKVVGDIPNTSGVHGVAVSEKDGLGFTSNGRDNTATVFDIKTLKVMGSIPVGQRPDAIVYDKGSDRVFTFNGGGGDATAIDAHTQKVVGTVKLDGRPEFAASDEHGTMFVNIEDKGEIERFDARTLQVTAKWPLNAESPSGLAIDAKHHLLFSVCDGSVMPVSDGMAGKVIATAKIGDGPDAAGFDPKWDLAFSSNGQTGTLTIAKRQKDGTYVTEDVQTAVSARTMALDTKTHRVFLASAQMQPPAADAPAGQRRRQMVPGSFTIIVVGPVAG